MSWLAAVPTAAVLLLLLYLPGWIGLRMLGVRGLLALAAAPAAVVAVVAVGGVVLDRTGVRWSLLAVSVLLVVVIGLCALLGRVLPSGRVATAPMRPVVLAGTVTTLTFFAVLQGAAYLGGMGGPDAVQQIYDPVFHLNATETIVRTGNASAFGGLDPMYGTVTGVFYPTAWHSIVALAAPFSSVVVASNAMLLVTGLVVWPLGVAALARAVAPRQGLVVVTAPVVAASFLAFPANVLVLQGMFPYGLAIALAPGVVALVVRLVQGRRAQRPGAFVAVVGTTAGVVTAHGAGVGVLALMVVPLLLQEGFGAGARLMRAGHRIRAAVVAGAAPALVVVIVVALLTVPRLRTMAEFRVPSRDLGEVVLRGLTSATTIGWTSPWANAVVAVLVLLGVVAVLVVRRTRWLAWAWFLTLATYVIAAGPSTPLRALTGFWYSSADRTQAMLPTVSAVLGGVGVAVVALAVERLVRAAVAPRRTPARHAAPGRLPATGAVAAVTTLAVLMFAFTTSDGFRSDERENGWTAWAFDPERLIHPPYATEAELDMIRSLEGVLPPDAVVFGDPLNGEVFMQSVAGAIAYVPHVNPSSWDDDQTYLLLHFRELYTDPAVCEIVRRHDIGYFYYDSSGHTAWREKSPGVYDVDLTRGFEPVAEAGPAGVYRITACG